MIDILQEKGYDPVDGLRLNGVAADVYELVVSGIGTVRLAVTGEDGSAVFAFDRFMAQRWNVRFSPGTPEPALLAVLESAEAELAAERGGPVT